MNDMLELDQETAKLKVPPHSLEAEQSVLGGLMLDNQAWDNVPTGWWLTISTAMSIG